MIEKLCDKLYDKNDTKDSLDDWNKQLKTPSRELCDTMYIKEDTYDSMGD